MSDVGDEGRAEPSAATERGLFFMRAAVRRDRGAQGTARLKAELHHLPGVQSVEIVPTERGDVEIRLSGTERLSPTTILLAVSEAGWTQGRDDSINVQATDTASHLGAR